MAKKRVAKKPAPKALKPSAAKYTRRADLGSGADQYFATIEPSALNKAAAQLRAIVRSAAPKASEAIKWGMPVYELSGMLCYIKAQAKYITLGFYEQGIHLPDPQGRLEGSGRNMRHVKVAGPSGVDAKLFKSWVKQAASMNTAG